MSIPSDIYDCIRKDILAYVYYYPYDPSRENKFCFAYPQLMLEDNEIVKLSRELFPDRGAIQILTAGMYSADDMKDQYGELVIMKLNNDHNIINERYSETDSPNQYFGMWNPSMGHGRSDVEFTAIANHRLSSMLMQVIQIQETVSLEEPLSDTVHLVGSIIKPETKLVFVSRMAPEGEHYYGPFETIEAEDGIKLKASTRFGMRIACIDSRELDHIYSLKNDPLYIAAEFLDAGEIEHYFEHVPPANLFDWVTDSELIAYSKEVLDSLGKIKELLPKRDFRAFKSYFGEALRGSADERLSPSRIERIETLLSTATDLAIIPESVFEKVLENASPEQVAEIALGDPVFKKKILDSKGVAQAIEQERAKCEKQLDGVREQIKAEKANLETVKTELQAAESDRAAQLAEMKRELETDVESLQAEKERLETGIAREKQAYEQAVLDRSALKNEITETIKTVSDPIAASGKILQSEILRQVVNSVYNASVGEAEEPSESVFEAFRTDEDTMTAEQIIDWLYERLQGPYGRSLSKNDVVNYCICLTQGYITMFSGLPGTGKTSLCNAIASALGLKNPKPGQGRFVEIGVEKGWTSAKDYIGYYNPLTKTYEQANVEAYRAFETLDVEAAAKPEKVAPYLVLLDEANLSPMEHYWAPFLRACDSYATSNTILSLGGAKGFTVPEHTRFMATVNFDHTTETLSPRFLDRCWVISLSSDALDLDMTFDEVNTRELAAEERAFSYEKLREAFGPKPDAVIDSETTDLFERFLRACKENGFPVSVRSQKMIHAYLSVATQLMNTNAKASQFAPLDYAISEKVLPQINGPMETYKNLLVALSDVLAALPLCKACIDKMNAEGETDGFVRFFS